MNHVMKLRLDPQGRLVLEAQFEDESVARALRGPLLAFVIVNRTPDHLVLDRTDNVAEAIDYLTESVESAGLEVTLAPDLQSLMSNRGAESALLEAVRNGEVPRVDLEPVPGFAPNIELLPHQVLGAERAIQVGNYAEFSVQGAGKTLIVLAAFAHWRARGDVDKLVVIGPLSSFQPWEDEISRCFEEGQTVLRWSGSAPMRTRLVQSYQRADIILCSYDTARRDVAMLREQLRMTPTALVLDESHYIKNFEIGARGAAALDLTTHATKRIILTGTPAPHSLLDLYTQFAFLWPGAKDRLLGSPQEYVTRLSRSDAPASDLRTRLAGLFRRTTQAELGLPEPVTHIERIPLSAIPAGQERVIRLLETKIAVEARRLEVSRIDQELLRQWQRARIVRLLQAASNPALLTTREDVPQNTASEFDVSELLPLVGEFREGGATAAKIAWVVAKARELISSGHKVLIWTWWVANLHLLADTLQEFNPLLLYGQIKPYEDSEDVDEVSRERNIREFKTRADRPLLIANPSACAESISLHRACHHALYVDRTYNCGQFLQSLNRIHRVGLPRGVTTEYWIPVLDCAIERSVDRRLQKRQQTMFEFLGDDSPVFGVDWHEETSSVDSEDETNDAFNDLLAELRQ